MDQDSFNRLAGRTNLFFHQRGCYFDVRKHGQLAVKQSLDNLPILDVCYQNSSLKSEAEKLVDRSPDFKLLSARFGQSFMDYLIRAHIDWIHYRCICNGLPSDHLAQESIFVTWGQNRSGNFIFHEIIVQPFIEGVNLGHMIDYPSTLTGKNELLPKYRHLKPAIGSQMIPLLGLDLIDFFPMNFIVTPNQRVVYIDTQPLTDEIRAGINRDAMARLINSWGL